MKQLKLLFWTKAALVQSDSTTKIRADQPDNFNLKTQLLSLINQYFPEQAELKNYKIEWSKRNQKRTLGSCNIKFKKIIIARELNDPRFYKYIVPLIYHELCHAALGYSVYSKTSKSRWHGKEFKALERLHPDIPLLNQWIKSGGWRFAVRSNRAKNRIRKIKPKISNSLINRIFGNFVSK